MPEPVRVEEVVIHHAEGVGALLPVRPGPGLNVLLGPNASGKTTLLAAIQLLLRPDLERPLAGRALADFDITAWVRHAGGRARARLVHGRLSWLDGPEPVVPPEAAEAIALALDDLAAGRRVDRDFVGRVRRELAGGVDLRAAVLQRPSFSQGPVATLREAQRLLAGIRREQARLADEAAALPGLRARRERAHRARRSLGLLDAALEVARARGTHERLQAELDALPTALARLGEDDPDRLELAERTMAKAEEAVGRHRERIEELERRLGLAPHAPEPDRLELARAELQRLEAVEPEVNAARREEAEAEACWRRALAELGGPEGVDEEGAAPSRAALQELDERAMAVLAARARRDGLRAAAGRLADLAAGAGTPPPEQLPRRLRALLRAARHEGARAAAGRLSPPSWWALLGLSVLAALLALFLADQPAVALALAVAAAALALAAALLGRALGSGEHAGSGDAPLPPSDGSAPLEDLLDELVQGLAAARLAEEGGREAARLHREAEEAEEEARAAEEAARERLGWPEDGEVTGLATALGARRLAALVEARTALHRARARRGEAEARFATHLAALQRALGAGEPPADLPAARVAVEGAERLRADRKLLETELEREREALRETIAQRDRAARERSDLLERLGCTDLGEVRALAAQREGWQELRRELDRAAGSLEAARARWARLREESGADTLLDPGDADPALPERPPEVIEARRTEVAREAEGAEALTRRIAAIETRVEATCTRHDLEEARAAVRRAGERVRAEAEAWMEARAACELASWLERRLHLDELPALAQRADRFLRRFTAQGWGLRFEAGEELPCARDLSTGRDLPLERLSSATRTHLLLAMRLAWIEEAEARAASGPLPLLLDETLGTADPERFEAVVEAMAELARSGRQVLHATADPVDAARWEDVARRHGIDLRRHELRPLPPAPLPALPPVEAGPPEPRPGETAAAWLSRIGQRLPSLFDPADAWPVALLLPDDLSSAHALARRGVRTLGQLRAARRDGPPALPGPALARLEAAERLLEAFLPAVRKGRGKPVRWEVVEASGAISRRFHDEVREVHARTWRDGRAFVQAVRNLDQFRSKKADQLADALAEAGCLPEEAPLDLEAILGHVLPPGRDPPGLGREPARRLVRWWHAALLGEPADAAAP